MSVVEDLRRFVARRFMARQQVNWRSVFSATAGAAVTALMINLMFAMHEAEQRRADKIEMLMSTPVVYCHGGVEYLGPARGMFITAGDAIVLSVNPDGTPRTCE